MGQWEPSVGKSDEWYTPKYVFDAMGVTFDLDVAAPKEGPRHVPARRWLWENGLATPWGDAFVWMNPPFGGRMGIVPWLDRFFSHGNGVCLTPDRTSAPWWQDAAARADSVLFVRGKIRFERPDGSVGVAPSNGTTLFSFGPTGEKALIAAAGAGLGLVANRLCPPPAGGSPLRAITNLRRI